MTKTNYARKIVPIEQRHIWDNPANKLPTPVKYKPTLDLKGNEIHWNLETINEVKRNPKPYPPRTFRFAVLLEYAINERAKHLSNEWEKTSEFSGIDVALKSIYSCGLGEFEEIANARLYQEELEEERQEARSISIHTEVMDAIGIVRQAGIGLEMNDADLGVIALILKASTKPDEWEKSSEAHTQEMLARNQFWSPADDPERAIVNISRVLPKMIDFIAYNEHNSLE